MLRLATSHLRRSSSRERVTNGGPGFVDMKYERPTNLAFKTDSGDALTADTHRRHRWLLFTNITADLAAREGINGAMIDRGAHEPWIFYVSWGV
ncbi:trna-dihydrouridine synthase 3-like [Moniliophthora roreri]|nr:trna-dihydrouridine synthase 3-like [Moniliophthora roreri]